MPSVAAALCFGVVSPASSGIGVGAFMIIRSANGVAQAFDMRENSSSACLTGTFTCILSFFMGAVPPTLISFHCYKPFSIYFLKRMLISNNFCKMKLAFDYLSI